MNLYKRLIVISLAALFNFHFVFGQTKAEQIVNETINFIINPLIWFLIIIASLLFFWGVAHLLLATGSGDEEGVKTGKKHLVWGLVGLFIMFSAKGIIGLLESLF